MTNVRALLIALVVAFVATLMVYAYVQKRESTLLDLSTPVKVVVAVRDIPEGARINDSVVKEVEIPKKFVQPGAIGNVTGIIDRVIYVPVLEGTQILESMLISDEKAGLAPKIPKDRLGFTIALNEVSGVAGLIQPGDFVDVLVTVETGNIDNGKKTEQEILTRVVLENILVLAVDQRSRRIAVDTGDIDRSSPGNIMQSGGVRPAGSGEISTATLAVKPQDCLRLNLAQEIGSLSLALRSAWSQGEPWVKKSLESHDFLGINKPLLPRAMPPWVEIRGSEQMSRY